MCVGTLLSTQISLLYLCVCDRVTLDSTGVDRLFTALGPKLLVVEFCNAWIAVYYLNCVNIWRVYCELNFMFNVNLNCSSLLSSLFSKFFFFHVLGNGFKSG